MIAIDGPAGSGKSTVSRALAARLGVDRLDTGAMYRAVAWAALRHRPRPGRPRRGGRAGPHPPVHGGRAGRGRREPTSPRPSGAPRSAVRSRRWPPIPGSGRCWSSGSVSGWPNGAGAWSRAGTSARWSCPTPTSRSTSPPRATSGPGAGPRRGPTPVPPGPAGQHPGGLPPGGGRRGPGHRHHRAGRGGHRGRGGDMAVSEASDGGEPAGRAAGSPAGRAAASPAAPMTARSTWRCRSTPASPRSTGSCGSWSTWSTACCSAPRSTAPTGCPSRAR